MGSSRKDDHIRHAIDQQRQEGGSVDFDDVTFMHHALAGIDRTEVSLATNFAGVSWDSPLFINAMTGGSEMTGRINRDLAIAARETGLAVACGSLSAYLRDPRCVDTFRVLRSENPDGFVMANVNAATSTENALRAVDLLDANALQIHLNVAQETVMPEGDRSFGAWPSQIERLVAAVKVPVIVKEVGFGLSRETLLTLKELGVKIADVSGRGGTDFVRIENQRRAHQDFAYMAPWGQSTPGCLLDARGIDIAIVASGGVRNPLDVVRSLALGASAVGVSGAFLRTVIDGGVTALVNEISTWLEHVAALQTMLGARVPSELTLCDVLVQGPLRDFCVARQLDLGGLASRSTNAQAQTC